VKTSSGWTMFIDTCIVLVGAAMFIYVYWGDTSFMLKAIVSSVLIFVSVWLLLYSLLKPAQKKTPSSEGITKLVMLDEDGQSRKEWYIHGEISLLIGKSSNQSEVDIDLSESEYASLISKQHAVLNYVSGSWFIEDVESRNGVGVKKARQKEKTRLELDEPHRIGSGDILYIANTRLLVK
jgi:hypothetical protein